MLRATIHQVLDRTWLEVEELAKTPSGLAWRSIGRSIIGEIEDIPNLGVAAEALGFALSDLLELTLERWYEREPYRI